MNLAVPYHGRTEVNVDHLPEPDLRWPVVVVETREYLLWAPGADSADAARALNRRDPILLLEAASREDQTGGGIHATAPAMWDDVEPGWSIGPQLADGSFWGPVARAAWDPRLTA
jgi:hypothetical protein